MKQETAKMDIKDLLAVGFTFVVLGIGLAYGLQIVGDLKTSELMCATGSYTASNNTCSDVDGSYAFKAEGYALGNTTSAVAKIPQKLGTVATIVMAAVIIGVLIKYLWVKFD